MAETDTHIHVMLDTINVLSDFFRQQPDVYVGGNLLFYYEEGNPRRSVAPDGFMVRGVSNHYRRTYKLWEEGVPPTVVLQFTSRSTQRDDITSKPELYARLGVQEFFLFDPLMEYLEPSLQGYRLAGEHYEPIVTTVDGGLQSEMLGLTLYRSGSRLRFVDTRTGEPLLWADEVAEARRQAEAQIAALQAELARLRNTS